MRTEIEALKEIRDRISYFCSRTDGKYDPPWAQEVIGIIDDVLITPYRQCKRFGAPFYVEVGTSIVAIRCASNHDVVWRVDHSVHGKATVDWAESVCTRMNQEAHIRELSKNVSKNGADFGQLGNAAKLREALKKIDKIVWDKKRHTKEETEAHRIATEVLTAVHSTSPEPIGGDCAKLREAVIGLRDRISMFYKNEWIPYDEWEGANDDANSALAAPARNCDRYATVDEAMEYFADEALIEEWNALRAGKDRDMLAVELFVFTKWLFSPATEQEGGAK